MSLSVGARVGPFEIVALLGAGGMGEVYRARDTKLNRDVALKVLPETVASDSDRVARFSREAQVLAALNHPNIAHIHGVEDSTGVPALVMELVDGPTLADRIARGSIPWGEALVIAKQLAEALEAAHEQGIIHRDLKPANIKVRHDGTVKVLDFGLAKALDPRDQSHLPAGPTGLSQSPTITTPAMMTSAGMILGTAAYMSPEQARGNPADKRADVWAFGVVLFEMLTGEQLFAGETISDMLASVLKTDPDWRALPPAVPQRLRSLLRWCLEKEPKRRLRDIGDARVQLEDLINGVPDAAAAPQPAKPRRWILAAASSVIVAALVLATGIWATSHAHPPMPVRFTIASAGLLPLPTNVNFRDLALSPDGARIVYTTGTAPANFALWVRALDRLDAVQMRGPVAPASPFISPDGNWIGYFSRAAGSVPLGLGNVQAGGTLMKVAMTGGPPIAICQYQATPRGASWGPNDTIVFATADSSTGLLSVAAGGGEPRTLTKPDVDHGEVDHLFPSVLPDGQAVLYTITARSGISNPADVGPDAQVAVLDLKTGQHKTLIRGGSQAEYLAPSTASGPGYLVYAAAGTLRAVRFDPRRFEVLSDPVPVVDEILTKAVGAAEFSASHGSLAYVPGGQQGPATGRSLVWVDRQGREEPINAPRRAYVAARLSPDGRRIALDIRDQDNDIWTWDLAHETLTRITSDPGPDTSPVWTPDGRRILFASGRAGAQNVYWQAADGTGTAERLTTGPNLQNPLSISPAGTEVVVQEGSIVAGASLLLLHLDKQPRIEQLVQTKFVDEGGVVSPDGRWLAYDSNESGQFQVFVRPFPNVNDGRWLVSGGGVAQQSLPAWAPNGRELFYRSEGFLMSVPVETSTTFTFGRPTRVLDARAYAGSGYDVSRDGQRFLMIKNEAPAGSQPAASAQRASTSMVVVLNWIEELKTRVPAK